MGLHAGIITNAEAFGKQADLERDIKKIGWTQTPFLSTIDTAAPTSRDAKVALGHSWFYDEEPDGELDNAHVEGGDPADAEYYTGGQLLNHYQIVKHTYGVSGSEEESKMVDGTMVMANQFAKSSMKHKKSIEMILLSDQAAVQRVNTPGAKVAGRCGGLKSFATANNTILAASADMSLQFLRELMKIGYFKGVNYSKMQMGDKQMDVIADLMNSKVMVANWGIKKIADGVTQIDTQYGSCQLMTNPGLLDSEVIAYDPSLIKKVNWRAMHTKELARVADEVKKEIISEFTLRVCHEYAFSWCKGLKV